MYKSFSHDLFLYVHVLIVLKRKKQHQCIDRFYDILQEQLYCFGFATILIYIFWQELYSSPGLLICDLIHHEQNKIGKALGFLQTYAFGCYPYIEK